jgi:hypothetical protein
MSKFILSPSGGRTVKLNWVNEGEMAIIHWVACVSDITRSQRPWTDPGRLGRTEFVRSRLTLLYHYWYREVPFYLFGAGSLWHYLLA